jgi:hypothetical protein
MRLERFDVRRPFNNLNRCCVPRIYFQRPYLIASVNNHIDPKQADE